MILSGNEILARLGGDILIEPFEPSEVVNLSFAKKYFRP